MGGSILIVDDEKDMLTLLKRIITEKTDHLVVTASQPLEALEIFAKDYFDLVITDLKMPKMDGIELLLELKKIRPKVSVVIMTAYATVETAVKAIQEGAYDYITKPFRKERILVTIEKVMQWQAMFDENLALHQALIEKESATSLVGASPVLKEVISRILQVAPTTATVLITGESGTGKELAARAIHRNSLRTHRKLLTINCAAIPEQVMESELFGHLKGAFTGAWQNKKGLVDEADEGTLFLDEIGDISPAMQTKLLRLVEEGEYRPVGSVATQKADIRFIAATNSDLMQAMREKRFRQDLYYRLNVVHIHLPTLAERREDVPLLAHHFLKKYARAYQKGVTDISSETLATLQSMELPGNVRELENIIERGVIFCRDEILDLHDLLLGGPQDVEMRATGAQLFRLPFKKAKDLVLREFHRQYIRSLLQQFGGNISKASEKAEIQRQYLHQLMKETGITSDQFKT